MSALYEYLKSHAYGLAMIATAQTNASAAALGHKDVYGMIMSDSGRHCQAQFLLMLPRDLPLEEHRFSLLNGMAREYAGFDDWQTYIDQKHA